MRKPAAKKGDLIIPTSPHMHTVTVPGPSTAQLPHLCVWKISESLSSNVNIEGKAAATEHSGGKTSLATHPPTSPGIAFASPPKNMNEAEITKGSTTVNINGKRAARSGDACSTCNEAGPDSSGQVISVSTVWIGG